jgi:hypothetical protein
VRHATRDWDQAAQQNIRGLANAATASCSVTLHASINLSLRYRTSRLNTLSVCLACSRVLLWRAVVTSFSDNPLICNLRPEMRLSESVFRQSGASLKWDLDLSESLESHINLARHVSGFSGFRTFAASFQFSRRSTLIVTWYDIPRTLRN